MYRCVVRGGGEVCSDWVGVSKGMGEANSEKVGGIECGGERRWGATVKGVVLL